MPILQGARSAVKLPRSNKENQARDAARERRRIRHERVRAAFGEVGTISGTAKREQPVRCCLVSKKKLGVSHWLVRQSVKPGDPPHRQFNKRMNSKLDPFESHLFARFIEDCRSANTLWLEVKEQGFAGAQKSVERWLRRQRLAAKAAPGRKAVKRPDQASGARNLSWLLLREGADLSSEEREVIAGLERGCPAVIRARGLALRFAKGLRDRQPKMLVPWLLEAQASGIGALKEFAVGLERELSAIKAAFALEWSNGPVEGVVNKIKLIKRQMFGRASFDLLRRRVLLAG